MINRRPSSKGYLGYLFLLIVAQIHSISEHEVKAQGKIILNMKSNKKTKAKNHLK